MFTGLIEAVGRVVESPSGGDATRLVAEVPEDWELTAGESVAVDGCCLTALPQALPGFAADLSPETLRRTCLADRRPGDPVNLERSLRAGDRLGGHVVQGHVDAVSEVVGVTSEAGGGARYRFALAAEDRPFVVPKGSVAIDGVSLTVAGLDADSFEVALVPHTLAVTAWDRLRVGSRVNVEHDVLGRYVLRAAALSGRVELSEQARRRLGL